MQERRPEEVLRSTGYQTHEVGDEGLTDEENGLGGKYCSFYEGIELNREKERTGQLKTKGEERALQWGNLIEA